MRRSRAVQHPVQDQGRAHQAVGGRPQHQILFLHQLHQLAPEARLESVETLDGPVLAVAAGDATEVIEAAAA